MRILFTACPFYGHVNTLLPLARTAAHAGHEVVVATGPDLAATVNSQGLTTWDAGPTAAEAGTPMSLDFFVETAAPRTEHLKAQLSSWRPDLVVSEETELAGAVVAASCGAPHVVHGLGVVEVSSHPDFVAGVDAFGREWGVTDLARRYLRAPFVSVCPPSLSRGDVRPGRETYSVRPAWGEPAPGDTLPVELASLPHDRTVHLTLGTVFHLRNPGVLERTVDAVSELPVNVVVTVGPGVDPAALGTRPRHVVVERYLPHAALLPHCDVVVSQGGAGVLLGALAHRLPQLVLPQGADQFANAEAAVRVGAALSLVGADATAPAVRTAVARLLEEPRFRGAAAAVGDEIEAMPPAGSVFAALTRRLGLDRHGADHRSAMRPHIRVPHVGGHA